MRHKRENETKCENPEAREIKQFKLLMKKQAPMEQKIYHTKILTSKLEERAGNDTKLMLASINAKLQIINQFVDK